MAEYESFSAADENFLDFVNGILEQDKMREAQHEQLLLDKANQTAKEERAKLGASMRRAVAAWHKLVLSCKLAMEKATSGKAKHSEVTAGASARKNVANFLNSGNEQRKAFVEKGYATSATVDLVSRGPGHPRGVNVVSVRLQWTRTFASVSCHTHPSSSSLRVTWCQDIDVAMESLGEVQVRYDSFVAALKVQKDANVKFENVEPPGSAQGDLQGVKHAAQLENLKLKHQATLIAKDEAHQNALALAAVARQSELDQAKAAGAPRRTLLFSITFVCPPQHHPCLIPCRVPCAGAVEVYKATQDRQHEQNTMLVNDKRMEGMIAMQSDQTIQARMQLAHFTMAAQKVYLTNKVTDKPSDKSAAAQAGHDILMHLTGVNEAASSPTPLLLTAVGEQQQQQQQQQLAAANKKAEKEKKRKKKEKKRNKRNAKRQKLSDNLLLDDDKTEEEAKRLAIRYLPSSSDDGASSSSSE